LDNFLDNFSGWETMLNAIEVNRTFDLPGLIGQRVSLKRAGGWYIGPCPMCGGEDRLSIKQTANGWRWFCRGCANDRYHSPIDYKMRADNLDFLAALHEMAGGVTIGRSAPQTGPAQKPEPKPKPLPDDKQDAWRAYVEAAERALWGNTQPARAALDYLHARGIQDDTLRAARLGLAVSGSFAGRVVIPCVDGKGYIWYVKHREPRSIPHGVKVKDKYPQLPGGYHGALYGADDCAGKRTVILTEGEFDALLLGQEAGSLAGVGTLGSAGAELDLARWWYALGAARVIFACYDRDDAGRSGVEKLTARLPGRVRLAFPPLEDGQGKDITDFWKSGGNLHAWVEELISDTAPSPMQTPMQTAPQTPMQTEPPRLPLRVSFDDIVNAGGLDAYLSAFGMRRGRVYWDDKYKAVLEAERIE